MDIGLYDLLLLIHVLLFVYWLGADLGVFYAARFAADPSLSVETRVTIANIMSFVDMAPRLSVPLIGAVGATLAVMSGALSLSAIGLTVVWFAALVWVGVNLTVYVNRHQSEKVKGLVTFDSVWRSTVLTIVAIAGLASFFGVGVTENPFLAAKLLIYSGAILMSLVLRVLFRPYRPALARIRAGSGGAEESAIMMRALSQARPAILGIWALTILAAAIGLWQPI